MDKHSKNCTKISGYLEKKGKKKMISSYKKYWFVLEGGLLLYYRSKDDYETISPCKGSISLGPPCIVKPGPSTTGVFQVQTRIATITLRAENREEQNKWMQAIITEINPQKNLQRMSHFRHSIFDFDSTENISQNKEQIRNSTPESESSHNSSEDIIQRLQKMGAQSYNPIGTINKVATLRHKDPKDPVPLPIKNLDDIKLNNRDSRSSEHIYERISAELRETVLDEDEELSETTIKSSTLPPQSFNTLKIKKEENRPETFIIENDTYAISIQKKDYSEDVTVRTKNTNQNQDNHDKNEDKVKENKSKKKLRYSKSFFSRKEPKTDYIIVENENYGTVTKSSSSCDGSEDIRDVNENNLLKGRSKNIEEENAYSIPNFFDETAKVRSDYEDADKVEYAEPNLFQVDYRSKTREAADERDKKKTKIKKKKSEEKTVSNKEPKLKKRSSFIRRVWKRKDKTKEKYEENVDEDLYETAPDTAVVEKVCVTDTTAVQMLSELQNILEQKMPILIERISSGMSSPTTTEPHESDENIGVEDQINDCQQNILSNLTMKSSKLDLTSPVHDAPKTKPLTLPPKKNNKKGEPVKSLDEILQELNVPKPESRKNKVKKLIKRFSEPDFSENDVVLRNCNKNGHRDEIDAGELSRLLEELAKVTSAPILTPGVTSSLNGSSIPDEELSKLLPIKQRRFSEPDYDIPRPHKSLTINQKRDVPDNVIGSTRFFGPILKPADMMVSSDRSASDPHSQLDSITPDSLETNIHNLATHHQDKEDNTDTRDYYKFIDRRAFYSKSDPTYSELIVPAYKNDLDEFIVDNEIYAEPRSISMNFQLANNGKVVEYEHNSEVFVDSLELCKNEVSTGF